MRFALIGDHADGLAMARALVASGRHELATYTGPSTGLDSLHRSGILARPIADMEEVLADPSIEGVIVAGEAAERAAQLRRTLQSERHVICVHPVDDTPDIAYEAAMIQTDARVVLLPLLAEALHPGITRLCQSLLGPEKPLGQLVFVKMERSSRQAVLLNTGVPGMKPSVPGWDVLRALGGEITEVVGYSAREELPEDAAALLIGRWEQQGLFQAAFLPFQQEAHWGLTIVGSTGNAKLELPGDSPGPAQLIWQTSPGQSQEVKWDTWNPWLTLVECFEDAVRRVGEVSTARLPFGKPSWQDAIRCLELDDAARRSAERRRASMLDYQEATEEVGFKGTMTLLGCTALWCILLLLILSVWLPWMGWLIVPVLIGFLGLQLLRWVVPKKE